MNDEASEQPGRAMLGPQNPERLVDSKRRDPREESHDLLYREEPCGCVRVTCCAGHSPQQAVESLGLTLDDLLCDEHRQSPRRRP